MFQSLPPPRHLILVVTVLTTWLLSSCHPSKATADFSAIRLPQPDTASVVLTGGLFHHDTTKQVREFVAVFSRRRPDRSLEKVVDPSMKRTRHYRVRLLADATYYVDILHAERNCRVWAEEVYTGRAPVWIKNFNFPYLDTTAHGGCMAGWVPAYEPAK